MTLPILWFSGEMEKELSQIEQYVDLMSYSRKILISLILDDVAWLVECDSEPSEEEIAKAAQIANTAMVIARKAYEEQLNMNKRELEEQIKKEIEERIALGDLEYGNGGTFIASTYRNYRLKGFKKEDIDYDMCHVFR